MLNSFLRYLNLYRRKIKYKKISYSLNAVDLIVDYIFKNKNNGFYLDVEGHEMNVFKGFDLSLYKPSIISVEFLDLDMKYLELKNNDLQRLVNSDLYKHLLSNNYYFVNWLHGDLIFAHNDFRD
jgi:hypothetical protein